MSVLRGLSKLIYLYLFFEKVPGCKKRIHSLNVRIARLIKLLLNFFLNQVHFRDYAWSHTVIKCPTFNRLKFLIQRTLFIIRLLMNFVSQTKTACCALTVEDFQAACLTVEDFLLLIWISPFYTHIFKLLCIISGETSTKLKFQLPYVVFLILDGVLRILPKISLPF